MAAQRQLAEKADKKRRELKKGVQQNVMTEISAQRKLNKSRGWEERLTESVE